MGAGKKPLDYGMAEALALRACWKQGIPVRLSGQDSRRATFNQRHSVLIDTENESGVCSAVQHCGRAGARATIYNSTAFGSGRDGV